MQAVAVYDPRGPLWILHKPLKSIKDRFGINCCRCTTFITSSFLNNDVTLIVHSIKTILNLHFKNYVRARHIVTKSSKRTHI